MVERLRFGPPQRVLTREDGVLTVDKLSSVSEHGARAPGHASVREVTGATQGAPPSVKANGDGSS